MDADHAVTGAGVTILHDLICIGSGFPSAVDLAPRFAPSAATVEATAV
jgi:hypothetical protein